MDEQALINALSAAVERGALRPLDFHFAAHMSALEGPDASPGLRLAAALLSERVGAGDVCLDLADCAGLPLFQELRWQPPESEAWIEELRRQRLVGGPGHDGPLILHGRRLYLSRYWHFEQAVVRSLRQRMTSSLAPDGELLRQGLTSLFPSRDASDWQKAAACLAMLKPFCVISGGPGTGKTRTVTSFLALLAMQGGEAPRIALAAPTGKAAARLTESIRAAKSSLPVDQRILERIPESAQTLHRLLGFRPGRVNPKYGPGNPLSLDVLVVDEASMVDLPLMARLLQALPATSRLILLGDKDQLSSVEAGVVLGDICGRGREPGYSAALRQDMQTLADLQLPQADEATPPIADHLVVLQHSWRFDSASGIGALAEAVNRGDTPKALQVLDAAEFADVELLNPAADSLSVFIREKLPPLFKAWTAQKDPQAALAVFNRRRVLCAHREGPQGVGQVNHLIEMVLVEAGLAPRQTVNYAGRPVMVQVNDHAQQLYNGDVGLMLPDPEAQGELRVFFETANGLRRILPSRLPRHETVYAMTVHKSQGSEFDEVLLLLPEQESRVLTRELLYTGITRARKRVSIIGKSQRLNEAIAQPVRRSTGLFEALWYDRQKRDSP